MREGRDPTPEEVEEELGPDGPVPCLDCPPDAEGNPQYFLIPSEDGEYEVCSNPKCRALVRRVPLQKLLNHFRRDVN